MDAEAEVIDCRPLVGSRGISSYTTHGRLPRPEADGHPNGRDAAVDERASERSPRPLERQLQEGEPGACSQVNTLRLNDEDVRLSHPDQDPRTFLNRG
jgi:hypothetical protein